MTAGRDNPGPLRFTGVTAWENKWAAVGMLGAGLLISAAWLLITVLAWSAMRRHRDIAGAFASSSSKHLPNPLAETFSNRAQTQIYHLILLMIGVFVLMYLGLGYVRLALV